MPDRDIMYSKLAPSWRRPYRLAKGDASARLLAPEAEKALAATLRQTEGCPGIKDLAEIVVGAVRSTDDRRWQTRADAVVVASRGHKHTRIAREVADGVVEGQGERLAGLSPETIQSEFVVEVLRRVVRHYAFGPIQPALVAERFASPSDAIAYEEECLDAMRLGPIARELLERQNASGLRAPANRARTSRSVEAMLEEWP